MISNAQKAMLHAAKNRLHLDDEDYRALLQAEAGVRSSNDLDNAGLNRVMKRLAKLGFNNTAKRPRARRPGGTITEQQQAMIAAQYEELQRVSAAAGNAGFATMAARMGFNRRQCGKAFPQTISDGIKVIEGQKRYIARLKAVVACGDDGHGYGLPCACCGSLLGCYCHEHPHPDSALCPGN